MALSFLGRSEGQQGPRGGSVRPQKHTDHHPFHSARGPLTAGQVATYRDLATYHLPLPQLPHLEDGDKDTDPQHY